MSVLEKEYFYRYLFYKKRDIKNYEKKLNIKEVHHVQANYDVYTLKWELEALYSPSILSLNLSIYHVALTLIILLVKILFNIVLN